MVSMEVQSTHPLLLLLGITVVVAVIVVAVVQVEDCWNVKVGDSNTTKDEDSCNGGSGCGEATFGLEEWPIIWRRRNATSLGACWNT